MSFNNQLAVAFFLAVAGTLAAFGLGPLLRDLMLILNANVIISTAIGLPILTTASLLVALIALQR